LLRAEVGATVLYRLGARRVWLFGSLAQGHAQDGHSDIDLAVEGLPLHRLDEAKQAVRRAVGRMTDIVPLETAPPDIRGAAMRTRRLLQSTVTDDDLGSLAEPPRRAITHYQWRIDAILAVLLQENVRSLIDFGCGEGKLLEALAAEGHFARLGGLDLDLDALHEARSRIGTAIAASGTRPVLDLWHGLITHRDPRLSGYEAATAVEVIEHLEPPQLAAFSGIFLNFTRPRIAIITTPNAEYNVRWNIRGRRHPDHRFEWDRATFADWSESLGDRWGYGVTFGGVGPRDARLGHPTQMAVFRRQTVHQRVPGEHENGTW